MPERAPHITRRERDQEEALERLRNLEGSGPEQARYALELLETERGIRVVPTALVALTRHPLPGARHVLSRLYTYYDENGVKNDPGCHLRVQIVRALRPFATQSEAAIAERATRTYEYLPPFRSECGAELRGNGLIFLNELDPTRACYRAVSLLVDPETARMSGEPALTAVNVLAGNDQLLPLYYYLIGQGPALSEVSAACLRGLAGAPRDIAMEMRERYQDSPDDLVLSGLFDLLLEHAAYEEHLDFVKSFLRATKRYDVYRYVVSALLASRHEGTGEVLKEVAAPERDRRKVEILLSCLSVREHDPAIHEIMAALGKRRR